MKAITKVSWKFGLDEHGVCHSSLQKSLLMPKLKSRLDINIYHRWGAIYFVAWCLISNSQIYIVNFVENNKAFGLLMVFTCAPLAKTHLTCSVCVKILLLFWFGFKQPTYEVGIKLFLLYDNMVWEVSFS